MDADSQARGRVGRSGGVPKYRNDILLNVVELYPPPCSFLDTHNKDCENFEIHVFIRGKWYEM